MDAVARVAGSDTAWSALGTLTQDFSDRAAGLQADLRYWKDVATELHQRIDQAEHEKAALMQRLDALKANNVALRIEIERLGAPEHASNAEAAAWRWSTGNDTQTIAVCELDGTEWIPVLSSRAGLAAVAAEIAKRNYGPQWNAGSVLARMALGTERGE